MREKVLIFGSNFPLATRIADLVRREFEVILYEFFATNKSDQTEVSTSFTGDLLSSAVTLHKARYVVFTSESLLHIHSPSSLSALINELRTCKQLTGVYLAWVDIAEPIMAMENRHYIQVLQGDSAYGKRITLLRKALEGVADSVLKVQSIYTPEDNVWSLNFLHLLFSAKNDATIEVHESIGDWEAFSADEVAEALISLLYRPSVIQLTHAPYPGGLRAFCAAATLEYRRWLVSQQTLPSANCTNQGFFAVQEHKKVPVHTGLHSVSRQVHCAVNYLYRKAPEAIFGTRSIASFRKELGAALARSIPREVSDSVDMIVPVPETGKMYAQGLAKSLDIPYVEAIYKSDHKRSFDIASSDVRREFLYSRLSIVPGLLTDKIVMVVDEAIFTGATLRVVARLLRDEGARGIYFTIPSPEARYNCKFNMQPKRNLLSEYVRREDLWSYFNVEGIFFQDEAAFVQSIEQDGPQCIACFIQRDSND